MNKPMTHQGTIRGCDARASGTILAVDIRETKLYWVDPHGRKFSKADGRTPGAWPMYRLALDTVKPIPKA